MLIKLEDITVVIPTYNEAESISSIVVYLCSKSLKVIVVDDNSPDGTSQRLRELQQNATSSYLEEHLKVIIRKDQRGLGSAVRRGTKESSTPYVLVMDGDGQHQIADVFALINQANYQTDLIYGSRFIEGGSSPGLGFIRRLSSIFLVVTTDILIQQKASDPLSGLFLCRKELILKTTTNGFKVLLDILSNNPKLKPKDVPMTLTLRRSGKSKMSFKELYEVFRIVFNSNCRLFTKTIKIEN